MGVEYRIVNKKNRTMYELGRGGWYVLAEDPKRLMDQELLEVAVAVALGEPVPAVVGALADFVRDTPVEQVAVFNDSGDETELCRALGYRFVGSRYEPADLDFLNRHLDGSEKARRMYSVDDWRTHPDFDRFESGG